MSDSHPEVDNLVDAELAFTLPLRSREGFDEDLYQRLVEALTLCATAWRETDCIHRRAVNVLVDLQPVMLAAAEAYGPATRSRIIEEASGWAIMCARPLACRKAFKSW
jgi:hypothetical protein